MKALITIYTICFCYFTIQVILYSKILSTKMASPIMLWWTNFTPKDRNIECRNGKYKCLVSNNRTYMSSSNLGAILFYGSQLENYDFPLPRNTNLLWAIYHEESPKNYAPFLYEIFQNVFNITSTFSRKSDFPITLQYLHDLNLIKDKTYYLPTKVKNSYLEYISPILYIQSECDTPMGRDELVNDLMKYIKIDSYGQCLRNKDTPNELTGTPILELYNEKYLQFISKYKFIIAFENSICEDYITEKLWRPLLVGSIPIYYGSPSVEDFLPNPKSAILFKDYKNIEALGNLICEINSNDTLYESYLKHKITGEVSNEKLQEYILDNHPIEDFECFVCEKVHKNFKKISKANVYECPKPKFNNTWYQHWQIGKCQAKALVHLINLNSIFSNETFENMWLQLLHREDC